MAVVVLKAAAAVVAPVASAARAVIVQAIQAAAKVAVVAVAKAGAAVGVVAQMHMAQKAKDAVLVVFRPLRVSRPPVEMRKASKQLGEERKVSTYVIQ